MSSNMEYLSVILRWLHLFGHSDLSSIETSSDLQSPSTILLIFRELFNINPNRAFLDTKLDKQMDPDISSLFYTMMICYLALSSNSTENNTNIYTIYEMKCQQIMSFIQFLNYDDQFKIYNNIATFRTRLQEISIDQILQINSFSMSNSLNLERLLTSRSNSNLNSVWDSAIIFINDIKFVYNDDKQHNEMLKIKSKYNENKSKIKKLKIHLQKTENLLNKIDNDIHIIDNTFKTKQLQISNTNEDIINIESVISKSMESCSLIAVQTNQEQEESSTKINDDDDIKDNNTFYDLSNFEDEIKAVYNDCLINPRSYYNYNYDANCNHNINAVPLFHNSNNNNNKVKMKKSITITDTNNDYNNSNYINNGNHFESMMFELSQYKYAFLKMMKDKDLKS